MGLTDLDRHVYQGRLAKTRLVHRLQDHEGGGDRVARAARRATGATRTGQRRHAEEAAQPSAAPGRDKEDDHGTDQRARLSVLSLGRLNGS